MILARLQRYGFNGFRLLTPGTTRRGCRRWPGLPVCYWPCGIVRSANQHQTENLLR